MSSALLQAAVTYTGPITRTVSRVRSDECVGATYHEPPSAQALGAHMSLVKTPSSPLNKPIVVPRMIPYIILFEECRLWLI